jgi:hypothetical protein
VKGEANASRDLVERVLTAGATPGGKVRINLLNKFPFPFQLHAVANIKKIAFDVYYLVSVYCLFHFSTEPNEIGK